MQTVDTVYSKLDDLVVMVPSLLNEKQRRLILGKIADAYGYGYGYGGMSRIQSLIGTSLPTLRKGRAEADEFINNITNKDTASTEQMEAREDQLCESAQAKGESDENADQEIRYHKLPKKDISAGGNQDDAIDSDKIAENSADNDKNPKEIKKIELEVLVAGASH